MQDYKNSLRETKYQISDIVKVGTDLNKKYNRQCKNMDKAKALFRDAERKFALEKQTFTKYHQELSDLMAEYKIKRTYIEHFIENHESKKCIVCDTEFTAKKGFGVKTCSDKCKMTYSKRDKKKHDWNTRPKSYIDINKCSTECLLNEFGDVQ